LKSEIINLLGKKCYDENGAINRKYISQKVFNNKSLLYMLQAIVHPAVMKDAKVWSEALPQTSPYFLRESAILFETGNYKELDFNILVIAPKAIRIERIKRRDGLTSEEIDVRLQQQWPEKKKQSLADFIIINDENTFLIPQILRIHLELHQIALRQRDMLLNINS
jgi:dephospho-CoA kinase